MRYCPSCHSVYPNDFRTCPKDQSELRVASELQPGMVLRGKYEILGKLGAGGMATVYRARHLAFAEVRAIKVVGNRLADDEDFLRRFRNEAVMARRLQHPNAVRVDDLDTTEDGRPFIVMEYVEGRNLREVVRREGALDVRRAVRIARQVASALAAAHDLGIVHRDIKPDNILLQGPPEAETAKVLDFGIAKIKEGALGDSDHVATRTGTVVGTPQYISPEQAMGRRGHDLDGRADLYSLGVVLYEMVTGRLPFESDTAMGIILHHLQTAPPPPHELRPDLGIPAPLSAVLLRTLEKDREKRFSSAVEMGAALDEILTLPLPARPETRAVGEEPEGARPLTPRPVPLDIDRFETRDMPRTPPADGRRTPVPSGAAAQAAPWTPPSPLTTPVSRATPPSVPTPIPPPTVMTARPVGSVGGPHATSTPPPLPSTAVLDAPPRRVRGKRPWWIWFAVAGAVFFFIDRRESRSRRSREEPASPAAVEVDAERGDPQIRVEVAHALKTDPHTRREEIEVEVDEGVVTLSGKAPVRAAREAEALARRVAGVREVRNDIERPEPPEADERPEKPERPETIPPDFGHPGIPPMPKVPRTRPMIPGITAKDVEDLLQEGRTSLQKEDPETAMGIYGAVLGMDPMNAEARNGMRDATTLLARRGAAQGRRPAPRPHSAPSPSPP